MTHKVTDVKGYRELSAFEIAMINELKQKGLELEALLNEISEKAKIDHRWMAIGWTDLQKGFMSVVRSIAKPEGF